MGNLATPEALVARWIELCKDPSLLDLPYRIELNAWGKIEMSPASNRHGRLQMALGGIRVPDVVWASAQFMEAYGEITPYVRAPEICVEIVCPSNVQAEIDEKIGAYLAAGATEVWLVSEEGTIRCFGASGERGSSRFPVSVTLPPPIPDRP
jgi:hypothetical protein